MSNGQRRSGGHKKPMDSSGHKKTMDSSGHKKTAGTRWGSGRQAASCD